MAIISIHLLQLVAVLVFGLSRAQEASLHARDCYVAVPALDGETCQQMSSDWGISLDDFIALNPGVACPNLVAHQEYCVMGDRPAPTTTQPPTTTTAPGNGIETPQPIIPGMVTNCNKFGQVKSTTTCKAIIDYYKITTSDLYTWNPRLASKCDDNLILGSYYCAGVLLSTPPSTTAPPNGVRTPYPLVGGVVSNCNQFALVQSSTTCERIIDHFKITLSDLVSWNTDLKSNCNGGLSLGAYYCVGVLGGTTNLPPTTTAPGNGITTPSPIQSGMVKSCNKFAEIKSTTTCQGVLDWNKISLNDFVKWNPAVKSGCTNLQTGTFVCVGVIGGTTQPPTTVPTNGIKTPTPTQTGMVTNCNKFAEVKETTTCQGILDYNKISLADFYKWNPAVGKNCESLWRGSFACVGVIGGTTTQPANPTPTPTQTGMVKGCTKWAFIKDTTTCQGVLNYYNISLEKFVKWNPAVGKNCENLWRGTYACVKGP